MKKFILPLGLVILLILLVGRSMGQAINVNNAGTVVKSFFQKKKVQTQTTPVQPVQNQAASTTASTTLTTGPDTQKTLKSYQNYDFVPGNNILFEDEFTDDQSGEFPTHWDLKRGQAILNMQGADKAFFMTDGNYCILKPLMKNESYLTKNFSVEFDTYGNGGYPLMVEMDDPNQSGFLEAHVSESEADWKGYGPGDHTVTLSGALPADIAGSNYRNKWHHIAIAYKNDQLKVYVDKYRVLIVPHCNGLPPASLIVEGIGDQTRPIIFKNFKIADGVQMYMTGQTFTDAKIVTHGINFDIDKATIKPESMGTLNMVVQVMKSNPGLKFEIDGHTDNTGTPAHNLTLSQQRSDAVLAQLIVMGIDASRLTSKGFGDTKPIADNTTLEGKANNRRVEFVKQ
ncbi:MAG: OmpA family protein [Sphingobacteriales bacterium]